METWLSVLAPADLGSMYRLLESPYVPVHVFAENESVAVAREIISSVTLIILSLGLIKQGVLFDT